MKMHVWRKSKSRTDKLNLHYAWAVLAWLIITTVMRAPLYEKKNMVTIIIEPIKEERR